MRTKIIATIGPKSNDPNVLTEMIESGLNIARFNFSHCTKEEYISGIANIKEAEKRTGKKVKILQDLKGPRIRVGTLNENGVPLIDGETVVFSTDKDDSDCIHIDEPELHLDISAGEIIYLANGEMELMTEKIEGQKIIAKVIRGGILHSRKGVNLPHTLLRNSGITEKDIADVNFVIEQGGADFIAISFVQKAEDVRRLKDLIGTKSRVIAKIETALALKNIDEITRESDAIMVARGDLGIEIPMEDVPLAQKHLIKTAHWHEKPSIVATQMLLSMISHPRPTRAEVSDVATAVFDGADAVMLSDETSTGNFPIESVKTAYKIAEAAENSIFNRPNGL